MSIGVLIPLILIGLLVGLLIGAIGIGGVLLVPSLAYIGDIPVHTAIPACMLSYIVSGVIGATIYARKGSINWQMAWWVCAGALPGAYFGALTISYLPSIALELIIAALIVFAGIDAIKQRTDQTEPPAIKNQTLLFVGFVTGVGSAMSGTGGPLVLVPILVWMKLPILMAVGLSQIVQLPISALATVGNLIHGHVDFYLGIGIAIVMITGVVTGARLAHVVPASLLKRIVAVVLIIVGIGMTFKIGFRLFLT